MSVPRLGMAVAAGLIGVLALAPVAAAAPTGPPVVSTVHTPTPPADPGPTAGDPASPTPGVSPTAGGSATPTTAPQPTPPTPPADATAAPPPAPGIALQVADVTLDNDVTVPGQLVIRLTNTGARPATAVVDLVVPAGVTVARLPADCQTQQQVDPTTTGCGLGTIPAGAQRAIAVPLMVGDRARADAPVAGLVRAALTPSGQGTRTTQASYQIVAPPAQTGVSAMGTGAPAVPQAVAAITPVRGDRAAVLVIFGSLAILAFVTVGLIVMWGRETVVRRRPHRGGLPPPETSRSWRPVGMFVPPDEYLLAGLAAAPVSPAPAPRTPDDAEAADVTAHRGARSTEPDVA